MDVDLESLLQQDPESVIIPTIRNHLTLTQKILEDGSTLLHLACKLQSPLQVIQTILEVSPDSARMPNKDLFLPLHVACAKENADVKIVTFLIKSHYNGLQERNFHRDLPIHSACANFAPLDVIKVIADAYPESLLEMGMNEHVPLITALSTVGQQGRTSTSEHHQTWISEVVTYFLSKHPKCATITDSNNELPLHWACKTNVPLYIYSQLISIYREAIYMTGKYGKTPLHTACEKRANLDVIKLLYNEFTDAIRIKDNNSDMPLHLACRNQSSIDVILFLISVFPGALLVNSSVGLPHYRLGGWDVPNDKAFLTNIFHSIQSGDQDVTNVWVHEIINNGEVLCPALEQLLDENPSFLELAYLSDTQGRKTLDAAPVSIKKIFQNRLFLCGIYEILPGKPEHVSSTSIVYFANDYSQQEQGLQPTRVAIKFMQTKEQFLREKETRQHLEKHFATSGGIRSSPRILPILASFDGETDISIAKKLNAWGLETKPFILVLPATKGTLLSIIEKESEGENANEGSTDESNTHIPTTRHPSWTEEVIRAINQIAEALADLHAAGLVHGDVEPQNIVRVDSHYKLIDMGAAVHVGQPVGLKLSTAYTAPEIALSLPDDHAFPPTTLSSPSISISAGYFVSDVVASPSLDAWSLGVTLYHMMARQSLFHADDFDNLALSTDLNVLRQWSDKEKIERLSRINNREARHLLSLLLYRDPLKRPSMQKVLSHAFLTGTQPKRLPDEPAKFDVFLSYRCDSDSDHVKALADSLVKSGLRVWWDENLIPGQKFLPGFCEALSSSRMFVPIVSRGAVNALDTSGNPKSGQNWSLLKKGSGCDYVLLEWRLACELREQGLMEGAVPVFFGDFDKQNGVYGTFDKKCGPSCPDETVNAVEDTLREQLTKFGLGEPLISNETATVKFIWDKITEHHGVKTHGTLTEVIKKAKEKICESLKANNNDGMSENAR
jgi:serine/threonine protein kinase/ankyrin repeat protein